MDWEQYNAKQQWAGETKPSMLRRRIGHDYQGRCIYMLTLVVKDRRTLLGHITGDGEAEPAVMHLSPMGEAVHNAVLGIPDYYPVIEIITHQVMPDHLHIVLYVHDRLPVHLSRVVSGFKGGCNNACRQLGLDTGSLWEEGFNDRILDRSVRLQDLIQYVRDNPRRFALKRAHPDLFRVQHNLVVGDITFAALGNIFLLDAPMLVQVQCSRSITPEQLAAQRAQCLSQCAGGAVLISPRISGGEMSIMDAAFDLGFPTILLRENGFGQYAKPGGRYFDACAQGRLLLLAPWQHHNRDVAISRDQCLSLNQMAWVICHRQ